MKLKLEPRKCAICGTKFTPKVHNQKYCSKECYRKADYYRKMGKYPIKPKIRPKPKKPYVMKNPTKVQCCVCGEESVIDNPNSEVGIFYCMKCLKKGGSTIPKLNLEVD